MISFRMIDYVVDWIRLWFLRVARIFPSVIKENQYASIPDSAEIKVRKIFKLRNEMKNDFYNFRLNEKIENLLPK